MDAQLSDIEQDMLDRFHIVRHELPILGDASRVASLAVLAAGRQGAYGGMYARLIRTPAVTDEAYVLKVACMIGLDTIAFLLDFLSPIITDQLQRSRAIADVFHFIGTPAFYVKRTAFLGTVTTSLFQALINEDKDDRATRR